MRCVVSLSKKYRQCHCEERSDVAIRSYFYLSSRRVRIRMSSLCVDISQKPHSGFCSE